MNQRHIFPKAQEHQYLQLSIERDISFDETVVTGGWSFTVDFGEIMIGAGDFNTPTAALKAAIHAAEKATGLRISDAKS
jgi:hypothetical protein